MKLTCLSRGSGYHFPPCHMLELSGFRVLLECPLDLSALAAFSPVPPTPATAPLIRSLPRYKTVPALSLWDPSLIDAVLVSSPAAMLGLPFLSRHPAFSAAVYATGPTAVLARLMMEELVSSHAEHIQFYGREEDGASPDWMKWEEIDRMSPEVRAIVMGEDGEGLASWLPLYSSVDAKECISKVQSLKYGEEACFNGTLILKALSSGLEIGSCNWMISGPRGNLTYLSSSIFDSDHAMGFDYRSLKGNDLVLFSDFSSVHSTSVDVNMEHLDMIEDNDPVSCSTSSDRVMHESEGGVDNSSLGSDDHSEEIDKLNFICSCAVDAVRVGGSVLIPVARLGVVLPLLEQISQSLECSNLKIPIYMISSAAEETLTFTSAVPEWLCEKRQQKLFSGEALFGHSKLMKEKKLQLFPVLHSSDFLTTWKEPCIVFSPHYSLRLGPIIHLLHRWHADSRCLLILEQGVDPELALLPFKELKIKILQCSFLSGIKFQKIQPLLKILQPKLVLFPEQFRSHCPVTDDNPSSILYYSENVTLHVPRSREHFEAFLDTDLAFQSKPRILTEENMAITRLKGLLLLRHGKYHLVCSQKPSSLSNQQLLHWGAVDPARLLMALQERGIKGSIHRRESDIDVVYSFHVQDRAEAVVETSATKTVIVAADETMDALIYEAVCAVSDGI